MALIDTERIEDADRVSNEHIERVIAVWSGRSAMAACVVSQHAVAILQRFGELVPHRQVGR